MSVLRQSFRPSAPGSQLPLPTCCFHPFLSSRAKSASLNSYLNCCQTSLATAITRICGALLSPSRIPISPPRHARPNIKKLEATPGIEPGIRALQAPALPLGHVASLQVCHILIKQKNRISSRPCQPHQCRCFPPPENISVFSAGETDARLHLGNPSLI